MIDRLDCVEGFRLYILQIVEHGPKRVVKDHVVICIVRFNLRHVLSKLGQSMHVGCSYCTIGIVWFTDCIPYFSLWYVGFVFSSLFLYLPYFYNPGISRSCGYARHNRSSIFPSSIRESVEFSHWWFIVFSFGSHTDASTCAVRLSFLSHQIERTILNRSGRARFIACEIPQHEHRFVRRLLTACLVSMGSRCGLETVLLPC